MPSSNYRNTWTSITQQWHFSEHTGTWCPNGTEKDCVCNYPDPWERKSKLRTFSQKHLSLEWNEGHIHMGELLQKKQAGPRSCGRLDLHIGQGDALAWLLIHFVCMEFKHGTASQTWLTWIRPHVPKTLWKLEYSHEQSIDWGDSNLVLLIF